MVNTRPSPNYHYHDGSLVPHLRHLHPVLLLALVQLFFGRMVADPVAALTSMLLPLVTLQILYLSFGLVGHLRNTARKKNTNTGSTSSTVTSSSGGGGKRVDASAQSNIVGTKILPAVLSIVLSSTIGVFIIFIFLILFGAPLTTHLSQTSLCALHISYLSVLPLAYIHHVDGNKWKEVISLRLNLDEVYGASLGTLLGAWLGAVPIPLDWDREWQKWPITIVVGAYMGYSVGRFVGMAFDGKKIPF